MKLMKLVVSLLLLSCLAAAGAVGRKISDYTETLSPQDAWLYEIAVPGVTNYKVTFGTIVTGVVARVPASIGGASNAVENLNGKATNTAFYTAMNLAGPALPMTSNAVDVGSFLLPVRTNWVNKMHVKERIVGPFDSVIIGNNAGASNTPTSLNYNTIVGDHAGQALVANMAGVGDPFFPGTINTLIGAGAGHNMTNAKLNTVIGADAAAQLRSGNQVTAVGVDAFQEGTTHTGGTAVGLRSGALNNSDYNTFIGNGSGEFHSNGLGVVTFGAFARRNVPRGSNDTVIGYLAMGQATNASDGANVFIGTYAGAYQIGNKQIGIGMYALQGQLTSPDFGNAGNVAIGYASLANTVWPGGFNVGVGQESGNGNTSGDHNTFLGYQADTTLGTVVNSTAVGSLAQVTKANQVVIGNTAVTNTVLRGMVGISTENPSSTLDVTGQVRAASAIITNMVGTGDHVAVNAFGLLMRTNIVGGGGGGDVTTAQLNTSSNAIVSFETTRNAAVSNALVSMLGTGLTNLSVYITFKTYGDAFVSSNLWVTQMITAARTDVVDANFSNIVLTNALGSNQVRLGRQDLTNYSYNPFVIAGVGGANTNFTLQAGQPEVIINAFTNVSLRHIIGTSATKIDYIRVTMTNGSGTDRTLEFSPATNSFRFAGVYGTNAPSVVTNLTQLHATFRVSGVNVLVSYDYYPWP